MKYIRLSRTLIARDGIMHSGTILPVEDANGMWKVKEGQFTGTLIPGYECEAVYTQQQYSEIYQELLQRREEVAELMKRLEQAEADEKRAVANADRLLNENIQLQQQLEEAREAKRVPLPREVAEALAKLQEQNRMWSLNAPHYNLIDSVIGVMRGTARANRPLATVTKWVADSYDRRDLIIKAVVNGYTIEEPQTFQTNRKLDESEIHALRNWYKGALLRMEDGTDPDGFAKEAIEEVALYLGGAELLKDMSGFCKNQLEREEGEGTCTSAS